METIETHVRYAAKAWVAAIIPIVAALFADVGAGASVDVKAWLGVIGIATAQWLAVYMQTNTPIEEGE